MNAQEATPTLREALVQCFRALARTYGNSERPDDGKREAQALWDAMHAAHAALEADKTGEPVRVLYRSGPAVAYLGTDGTIAYVDADNLDATVLAPRERVVCVALLEHALKRLRDAG